MTTVTASKKRLVALNAAANWTGFMAQVVLTFVVAPVLVHGLGERRYGIWAFVDSILGYLTLLDLGVGASVVRYVARFEAIGERDQLNRTFSTSLVIFSGAGITALAIIAVLLGPAWPLLRVPPDLAFETWWLMALLAFNLALNLPFGVFGAALDGLQRFVPKISVRTGVLVVQACLSLAIVRRGGGLIPLALGITACNAASQLILAAYTFHSLPGLRFSPRFVDRETFRTIRGYSTKAFVAMIAGRVSFHTDALVIATFLAPEQITYFVIGARLVEYAKDMLRSVTMVLTPFVSQRDALGDEDAIRRLMVDGTRWVVWLFLPVQLGLLILGKPFLQLWMGPSVAEQSWPILAILSTSLMLVVAQFIAGRVLYGKGQLTVFTAVVVGEAVLNLVLSIALVRPLGIRGVALGTLLPNLISSLLVIDIALRLVEVPIRQFLLRVYAQPLLTAIVPSLIWTAAVVRFSPMTWPLFLAFGTLGFFVYLAFAAIGEFGSQPVQLVFRRFVSHCLGKVT